ncbi:hypothetical protein PBY51_017594 [Eleginops maclovinus]|uniref:Uncharacterized protein n=1 Tax=Eleginops maclovinus TaxID=56733 RepID=A0AAN7XKB3_ELEMC|nr:hypothetical protein PBY51_017594 [Eleginops maclovinus]
MIFAVRRHFLHPAHTRTQSLWINCGSGSERGLRVIETGKGGSGVGICTAVCDEEMDGRRGRGGNGRRTGALTPLSLLRLKTHSS